MNINQLIRKKVQKTHCNLKQLLPGLLWVVVFFGLAGTAFGQLAGTAFGQLAGTAFGQRVFTTSFAENQVLAPVNLISIDFEDVPIQEALGILARSANVGLTYNSGIIPEKSVSRSFQKVHPVTAMMEILKEENLQVVMASNGTALLIRPAPETIGRSVQQAGEIRGRVTDATTGEELIGVHILVENTAIGASTNHDGDYRMTRVPEGDHTLIIGYLGFVTKRIQVSIVGGEMLEIDIQLSPDVVEGAEITIYTQALGQARAIRQQLSSNTIVNVVSETRLRELPDANAAESIGRLPGISVLRDAGEGQKVAIRGMGPRYSSITIDGNRVPGTDGDRSVDLSMISPEMLAGIEVYKAIRPDMDADAIGGSVNFRMGGAPSETRYRVNLESGYNNQISGVGNYKTSLMGSSRFLDQRLGVMVSANAQQVDRSAHVQGASYRILRDARDDEPHAPIEVNSLNLLDMQSTRQRYGGGVSLDWRLPNGRLFMNNMYSRQNREDIRHDRRYNLPNNRQEWRPRRTERNIYTLNTTVSGEHDIAWAEVEWRLNRSVTSNNTPYDHQAWFFEPGGLDRSGVDLTGGPQIIPTLALNRTDRAYLETLLNQEIDQRQENLSASLDIQVPVVLGRYVSGYVKFGGKHYNNYRDRTSLRYRVFGYHTNRLFNNPDSTFPWLVNPSGRASMMPFITDPERRYMILDGGYEMAHMPNIDLIDLMWDSYSDIYQRLWIDRFDDYEANERLSAGYVMTELNIGPRLMILPGVRYEYEHSDFKAVTGEFQGTIDNITEEDLELNSRDSLATRNMGMWFPMVQARYRVTNWFDIRAARTVSTSRPNFGHLSPQMLIGYDRGSVNRSNSQIRPMRAINYDLFLTFNQNRLGLFTVGGFYKEVEDVIYMRNANIVFPDELGLPANTRLFQITEPVNNENLTTVHGFEVEWQSNLTWLPVPFNGLVLNANYSRFFSEAYYHSFEFRRTAEGIVGVDTFRVAPMVHQADHIANVSVGYDYRGFSSRISMQYQGATLRSIGARPELDRYTDDYLRFDASIRQRFFSRRLSLFANLHNITNREDRSSQFTYDRPSSIEYYGAAFDIGMEFRF
jgi:TonB-dependent receptor